MSEVFLKLLNLSITASWLILAVVIIRPLLKKAPKWINCALWALVALRLVCPFSLESALSLIPSSETIPYDIAMQNVPAIDTGISAVNQVINPIIANSFTPDPFTSANPLQVLIPVVSVVWMVGMAALLLYALISYIKLKKNVGASIALEDNIMACDEVKSPFILGIMKPVIYVPSFMSGETLECVLNHEAAHIKRHDHWWKPLGYLLLTVYWFNPLCWLAYILLSRDIEMACDEKVIRDMDRDEKAAYSQALLNCNFPRKKIAACPLAFGEIGVKERVKSVLNYKKPAFWIIVVAVIACVAVAVCFMTNPKATDTQKLEVTKWFDCLNGDEMIWDGVQEINLDEYPGIIFRWSYEKLEAVTDKKNVPLYTGMPIWSVYFCDFNNDGRPELCSTLSIGSGMIDNRIIIYDYAMGASYELSDRGQYDYTLNLQNGKMMVEKRRYMQDELLDSGELSYQDNTYQIMWNLENETVEPQIANRPSGLGQNEGGSDIVAVYEANTDLEAIPDGEFTIVTTYYELSDGTWSTETQTYKYRLEITGRAGSAVKDTTYLYLSNIEDISFNKAMMAAGLSSNTNDYFDPEDAVFIGFK